MKPYFTETNRGQLITEARSWIGTPFRERHALKGIACDCVGLLAGVMTACGAVRDLPPFPPYALDEGSHSKGEKLKTYLRSLGRFHEIEAAVALTIAPGDILTFDNGLSEHHAAIAVGTMRFVHAYSRRTVRKVIESYLGEPLFFSRLRTIFRALEWEGSVAR